ncbi:MAG: hypothetical protein AB1781_08285 [Pseudomonadota bacterium]
MNKPSVLFVFTAESYHRESAPVISEFVRRDWNVTVLLGFQSDDATRIFESCRQEGIAVEFAPGTVTYGKAAGTDRTAAAAGPSRRRTADGAGNPLHGVRSLVRKTGLMRLIGFPAKVAACFRKRKAAEAIVARLAPSVVVAGPFHSAGQFDNAIARACRKRGTAMYCLPNSPYLGERILRVARPHHLDHGMAGPVITVEYDWLNRLLGWIFPKWTRRVADGRRLFYWDPLHVLAAELAGLQMNRLWLKPSLDFKRVFVHSAYSRDLLLTDGYPAERIVVSGPPLLDAVWAQIGDAAHETRLFAHIRLPVGSPFILFNVEPSAEHDYCDWDRHWSLFHETMAAVIKCGLPVVLSLHPLCRYEDYRFAEDKYGVTICTEYRIHALYPYCTVSVSFPCSTNLLCDVFGKPLVIYDHFGLTIGEGESCNMHLVPGGMVARSAAELCQHIKSIIARCVGAETGRDVGGRIVASSGLIVDVVESDVQATAEGQVLRRQARGDTVQCEEIRTNG